MSSFEIGRPKRLFILVNPFGGKKSGRKIFHSEVKPLLVAAGILYTVQGWWISKYLSLSRFVLLTVITNLLSSALVSETEYQLHAQEIAYSVDLLKYDGIVCVSGDGILVEVSNCILTMECVEV